MRVREKIGGLGKCGRERDETGWNGCGMGWDGMSVV